MSLAISEMHANQITGPANAGGDRPEIRSGPTGIIIFLLALLKGAYPLSDPRCRLLTTYSAIREGRKAARRRGSTDALVLAADY